jgi:hypothetical protein
MTVRKARATPPPQPKPPIQAICITLSDVTIQVKFASGEASPERVAEALQAALVEVAAQCQNGRA